eukprot:Em0001g2990a
MFRLYRYQSPVAILMLNVMVMRLKTVKIPNGVKHCALKYNLWNQNRTWAYVRLEVVLTSFKTKQPNK